MVNPRAVPRSKSAAPCTVKQHAHPATSCSCGGAILLQLRPDWVVNIAHSRKHHTCAEHAVLLCTYGRGLGFTGKLFCSRPAPRRAMSLKQLGRERFEVCHKRRRSWILLFRLYDGHSSDVWLSTLCHNANHKKSLHSPVSHWRGSRIISDARPTHSPWIVWGCPFSIGRAPHKAHRCCSTSEPAGSRDL